MNAKYCWITTWVAGLTLAMTQVHADCCKDGNDSCPRVNPHSMPSCYKAKPACCAPAREKCCTSCADAKCCCKDRCKACNGDKDKECGCCKDGKCACKTSCCAKTGDCCSACCQGKECGKCKSGKHACKHGCCQAAGDCCSKCCPHKSKHVAVAVIPAPMMMPLPPQMPLPPDYAYGPPCPAMPPAPCCCPPPEVMQCIAKLAKAADHCSTIKVAKKDDSPCLEVHGDGETCMSCKKMCLKMANGSSMKVAIVHKPADDAECQECTDAEKPAEATQVKITAEGLKATADKVVTNQKDKVVLEGHVHLCYHHEGQHAKVTAEKVTVKVSDGGLVIKTCGVSSLSSNSD